MRGVRDCSLAYLELEFFAFRILSSEETLPHLEVPITPAVLGSSLPFAVRNERSLSSRHTSPLELCVPTGSEERGRRLILQVPVEVHLPD
jgi:hypothetical protein